MGILNLTPDSFSDGGQHNLLKNAVKHARKIEKEGADIIDIGGESTGPNSKNISLEEELSRVIPILKKIRKNTKLPISIDTWKAEVARQALEEGADMINDVTALRGDKKMAKIAAKYQCQIVLMYSKDSTARTTVQNRHYKDVIQTIKNFLKEQIVFANKHGIKDKNIIIDPGMGQFISNIPSYSYEIIARLQELQTFKKPVLIGISRKSFLGGPMEERDIRGLSATAIAILNGASIIRTHQIFASRKSLDSTLHN
ncbi:dihydropteroate synthase [Candidatus Peregrinibacteria bacterium]|nr:dihydropteroate synthase [Candidatus Peregrinibacteria bacterium]